MNIYVINSPEIVNNIQNELQDIGSIIPLTSGNKRIETYSELFADTDEKILALDPGIIEWQLPVDILDKIINLRAICTSSAWARFIDYDYCKANSIIVTHTVGANSESVAEYAIWMMFSLARQLPYQYKNNWQKNEKTPRQTELFGKNMGIIGFGNIGSRIAALGRGLGMNVTYWNRSIKQTSFERSSLEEVLCRSDVVINCLEICPETQGLLNRDKLKLMKSSAFFVSILGGMGWGVQDDQYLIDMVSHGQISGFAVENEHKGEWPNTYHGNIFIPEASAHNTQESDERVYKQWIEAIKSVGSDIQTYRIV